jgi:hypothetical protein
MVPRGPLRGRRRQAGDAAHKVAQLEFRPASNSFSASAAAVIEFLAVQRGWRDFRMAH